MVTINIVLLVRETHCEVGCFTWCVNSNTEHVGIEEAVALSTVELSEPHAKARAPTPSAAPASELADGAGMQTCRPGETFSWERRRGGVGGSEVIQSR